MTGKFIIESFWQKKSNCVAIVLIKAAILTYGIGRVFKIQRRGAYQVVTLKDGRILVLGDNEINKINRKNAIVFSRFKDPLKKKEINKLKEYVELCFAIIARSIQINGYDGKEFTQSEAIRLLTHDGLKIERIHSLLGLSRKTRSAHTLTIKHLKNFHQKKAVLLYSDVHIVVASGGYYESYGHAVEIRDDIPILKRKKAKYWFELA